MTRNVGIIAHIDAGKTTTTERMLLLAGVTRSAGEVDAGDTVTDFLEQERERGITIQSAATSFGWHGATVSLIDTPGHVDFTVEVERAVRVLDGAVLIVDAVAGAQAQTETVWRQASRYGVPAVCFLNKMDREGANARVAAASLAARLRLRPLLLQLPIYAPSSAPGGGDEFVGVVDLISGIGLRWVVPGAQRAGGSSQHRGTGSRSSARPTRHTAVLLPEASAAMAGEAAGGQAQLEHESDAALVACAAEARAALVAQVAELEMDDQLAQGGGADAGEIAELFLAEQPVPPQV